MKKTVLYVHGMGGGADSRIPNYLKARFGSDSEVKVVCRTYDFNPLVARKQLDAWFDELRPDLVIGESLGTCHAMRLQGVPHIYVSPSLNGPAFLGDLAFLSLIPGVPRLVKSLSRKTQGRRQVLDFHFSTVRHYRGLRSEALRSAECQTQPSFAFFGTRDSYRKSGVVSVRSWKRHFGPDSYAIFEGSHYMPEASVDALLIPEILAFLGLSEK